MCSQSLYGSHTANRHSIADLILRRSTREQEDTYLQGLNRKPLLDPKSQVVRRYIKSIDIWKTPCRHDAISHTAPSSCIWQYVESSLNLEVWITYMTGESLNRGTILGTKVCPWEIFR